VLLLATSKAIKGGSMKLKEYYQSLSGECHALKNRVRHFIHRKNWLADGEWKESVLRSLISRSSPDSVKVGRGFVVTHDWASTQIDILLYDASHPVLYRDGDLVFISPSACRGLIEVKTRVTPATLEEACDKLAENAQKIREEKGGDIFVGIFSYEATQGDEAGRNFLDVIKSSSARDPNRIINHASLGDSLFIRYWDSEPKEIRGSATSSVRRARNYRKWHLYGLPEMAFGYFIHNVLVSMTPHLSAEEQNIYFPLDGKEIRCIEKVAF
jgi:hypothetical protein